MSGKPKHGHAVKGSKEYHAWENIKQRCTNPKAVNWNYYGGRGITMCERWRCSFEDFLNDVGFAPSVKHSIDRKDNDKPYEPGNVRWATPTEQRANQRPTRGRKLRIENVRQIRKLLASGCSRLHVAQTMGISKSTVLEIDNQRTWKGRE